MRKYNPYRNIFYYYRGPGYKKKSQFDTQIEDNTTKALVNVLENCRPGLLKRFLAIAGIDIRIQKAAEYDLQVEGLLSRPDAEIQIGDERVFIESKIGSALEEKQIERHLAAIPKGFLVCITPRDEDRGVIKRFNKKKLKFITWREVYVDFDEYRKRSQYEVSNFVISEFLEYLEAISMAPFKGWEKGDFEAFLNIDYDPKRELRIRVKEKFKQYLFELKELIGEVGSYVELVPNVGFIKKDSTSVWGVLCKPPVENKVQKPHFNFWVNSDEFGLGIQIEGKHPAGMMRGYIKSNSERFVAILKKLEGFNLIIQKRVNPTGRPRAFHGIEILKLRLGGDISNEDVRYVISKIDQYKLFQINCGVSYKRNEDVLGKESFLRKSAGLMKKLSEYYSFSWGRPT
ncbi:MAG TPA: hypothetical protein VMW93_04300 [bacterium]|nr:hypothetical protein [bacterium]